MRISVQYWCWRASPGVERTVRKCRGSSWFVNRHVALSCVDMAFHPQTILNTPEIQEASVKISGG